MKTKPFFVVDGIDGCGKSSQSKLLAEKLEVQNIDTIQVRDPGGTSISEDIRKVILDTKHVQMFARTELYLYTASRVQLIEEILKPAREAGKVIVSDRYISSTIAYQSFGGEMPLEFVENVIENAVKDFMPTHTFIIDLPLEIAQTRLDSDLDRMELKDISFKERVREGFLYQSKKGNTTLLDGTQSIEAVHKVIMEVVNESL